jgi:hypothetical protein
MQVPRSLAAEHAGGDVEVRPVHAYPGTTSGLVTPASSDLPIDPDSEELAIDLALARLRVSWRFEGAAACSSDGYDTVYVTGVLPLGDNYQPFVGHDGWYSLYCDSGEVEILLEPGARVLTVSAYDWASSMDWEPRAKIDRDVEIDVPPGGGAIEVVCSPEE